MAPEASHRACVVGARRRAWPIPECRAAPLAPGSVRDRAGSVHRRDTLQRSGSELFGHGVDPGDAPPEGDAGFVGIGTVVDSGDPARAVQTAAALVDTPEAAARAAQTLGKGWSAGNVSAAVAVAPLGASDVLAVTATAPTAGAGPACRDRLCPQRDRLSRRRRPVTDLRVDSASCRLASTSWARPVRRVPAGRRARLRAGAAAIDPGHRPRADAVAVTERRCPATANGASKALILLLALFGGFAVGSVAALALETFSRPVRDREEIASLLPGARAGRPSQSCRAPTARTAWRPGTSPPHVFEQIRMLRVQLSLVGDEAASSW